MQGITADEWAYVLYGNARWTVMNPDGTMFIARRETREIFGSFPLVSRIRSRVSGPDGTGIPPGFQSSNFLGRTARCFFSEWCTQTRSPISGREHGPKPASSTTRPERPSISFPGKERSLVLEQDKAEIGGETVASNTGTPSIEVMAAGGSGKQKADRSGWDSPGNFPVSQHIAALWGCSRPVACVKLHWHPNGSEGQFGSPERSPDGIFFRVDNARKMDFNCQIW